MQANGRRRWRKWKRNMRATTGIEAESMVYKGKRPKLKPLPAKPFTPRSLVGMTQGARKRAVYRADPTGHNLTAFNMAVEKYRIGEQLRPCPNCPDRVGCFECYANRNAGLDRCRWCRDHDHCEGSGVLPARRYKLK